MRDSPNFQNFPEGAESNERENRAAVAPYFINDTNNTRVRAVKLTKVLLISRTKSRLKSHNSSGKECSGLELTFREVRLFFKALTKTVNTSHFFSPPNTEKRGGYSQKFRCQLRDVIITQLQTEQLGHVLEPGYISQLAIVDLQIRQVLQLKANRMA